MDLDAPKNNHGLPLKNTGWVPVTNDAPQPAVIPDHELLRCIGRGSYGTVWLARNRMGVHRAVKIVYRMSFADQRPFERELSGIRRFEPISRSHEGFVDVLHVGINEAEGYFYYVMELGDDHESGQNIDPETYSPKTLGKEISHSKRLPFQQCLELGLALSQALAELHKNGLVHRDVKPSNIIFVNGVPKLADIGLVAEFSEARSYVGTEGFIPPEGPGTPQADVYSLGKVLYEASTGKDRHEFPELPTILDQLQDHERFLELNEVILHACNHDLKRRYRSAWDMHANLLVLANGKSVKRLKVLERQLSAAKRLTGLAGVILFVAAALSYPVYRSWKDSMESHERQVVQDVAFGNRAMDSGDLSQALPYFVDALHLHAGNLDQQTNDRLRVGSVLSQIPKLTQFWKIATNEITDGEFSPEGAKVVVAGFSSKTQVYELSTGKMYSNSFGDDLTDSAVFSPDGRWIATASERGSARIWDAATLAEIACLQHTDKVYCARFSPDGGRMVTACGDKLARVWNLKSRLVEFTMLHKGPVRFADFSHDGKLIVTGSEDGTARIWDAKDGVSVLPPLAHGSWVMHAAFSPDDTRLVTSSFDRKARVWDLTAGGKRFPLDLFHPDGVESAEFSPDGRFILTACLDGAARLWLADSLRPACPTSILKEGGRLSHASFSPSGRCIITTSADGVVRVWDLAGESRPTFLYKYVFSQDGSRFLTVTNTSLGIGETSSGLLPSRSINAFQGVESAGFNRCGTFFFATSPILTNASGVNRLVQVYNTATGEIVGSGISVSNSSAVAALSEDGKRLLTMDGQSAECWDVSTRTKVATYFSRGDDLTSVIFAPDGNSIAAITQHSVYVWETANGQLAFPPLVFDLQVAHADFNRDGSDLVTSCYDQIFTKCSAQVWNTRTGSPVGLPLSHGDGVLYAAFSSDGSRIATGGEDFKAWVWATATGLRLTRPMEHEDQIQSVNFSMNDKWLVTASSDKTARIWDSISGDPLTPPLRQLLKLKRAVLTPGCRQLVANDQNTNTWVWELPFDARSCEDLHLLARLLSADTVPIPGSEAALQNKSLESIWRELKAKYPAQFSTSPDEIASWHEYEALESHASQQWFAEVFQLQRLLWMRPHDPSLEERLDAAERRLKDAGRAN